MQFTTVALALAAASGAIAAPLNARQTHFWTVDGLSRVCAADGSSCTYTLGIDLENGTPVSECVIVDAVPNAPDASWSSIPCSSSAGFLQVSWGFDSTSFAIPFATLVVHDTQNDKNAFFGVSNPNAATSFGNLGPSPVQ